MEDGKVKQNEVEIEIESEVESEGTHQRLSLYFIKNHKCSNYFKRIDFFFYFSFFFVCRVKT